MTAIDHSAIPAAYASVPLHPCFGVARQSAESAAAAASIIWHEFADLLVRQITAPRPFAGLLVPLYINSNHILSDFAPGVLMVKDPVAGERPFISALDALVIAEMSSFDKPKLTFVLPPPF